jgi:hypothetical protein
MKPISWVASVFSAGLVLGCGDSELTDHADSGGGTGSAGSGGAGGSSSTGGKGFADGGNAGVPAASGGAGAGTGDGGGGQLTLLPPKKRLIVEWDYGCVIDPTRTIQCWGSHPLPVVADLSSADKIAGSDDDVCVLRTTQVVDCFTDDFTAPPSGTFTDLTGTDIWACAVGATNGLVSCWSAGSSTNPEAPSQPMKLIDAGTTVACGIRTADGGVECWATPEIKTVAPSYFQTPSGEFSQVTVGLGKACALMQDGTPKCWGDSTFAPAAKFVQLAGGQKEFCGILSDGEVYCWGSGDVAKSAPPPGPFVEVEVVLYNFTTYACGIRKDGSVACWGAMNSSRTPPSDIKALVD